MFKPKHGDTFTLRATLENIKDGDASFRIRWREDLDQLKNKQDEKELDERASTIENCKHWQDLTAPIKSEKAEVEADSTVPYDSWRATNDKEIYACIRAEYKFIVGDGYEKVQSRVDGSNGIDHLFTKSGERAVVVESKTIADLSRVTNLLDRNSPTDILGVLIKRDEKGGKKGSRKTKVGIATQMSVAWIRECLTVLRSQSQGGKKTNVDDVVTDMEDGKLPERVVNIYGGLDWNAKGAYDDLVAEARLQYKQLTGRNPRDTTIIKGKYKTGTRKSKGTLERREESDLLLMGKKWITANPDKGEFFLLPGKYDLRVNAAEHTKLKTRMKGVDFADEPYRDGEDGEFFYIDKLSKKDLKEFEKLVKPKRAGGKSASGKAAAKKPRKK